MTSTTAPPASPTRSARPFTAGLRSGLLGSLDAEWARLRTSRRALRTARSWSQAVTSGHPLASALEQLEDLDQLIAATQRRPHGRRTDNDVLIALVAIAKADDLAGRVVLQHLLPGLIDRSRRYRSFRDRTDPLEIAVPMAWIAIRSYDTEQRPRHVAASLLSDTVFQAFRRPMRRLSAREEVRAPSVFVSTPHRDDPDTPLDEFVAVLRESARAGVPTHDLDLLRHLVRAGSPGVVARERSVTPRTIRNHRDRAIDHVRAAVAVAA